MKNIPHTRFTTDLMPRQDRFDVWRDSISVLFQVDRDKDLRNSPFEAHLDAFMLNQIMIAKTRSNSASYKRFLKNIRTDGIDMVMLQLILEGDMSFGSNKNQNHMSAGDIVIFDLNQETRNFNTNFENISVIFPREIIEEFIPTAPAWHGKALPRNHPMTSLLKSHIISLHEFGPQITIESSKGLQQALVNLTSTAFQASADNLARSAKIIAATQLREIKKHIKLNLVDPGLSPDSIAKSFGLSRAQLYRITEPLNGIANYIQEERLKHCWSELQTPGSKNISITELGFKWGYNDIGTFTRNFKKTFGMLPKDARAMGKLNTTEGLALTSYDNTDSSRSYESWLRTLAK